MNESPETPREDAADDLSAARDPSVVISLPASIDPPAVIDPEPPGAVAPPEVVEAASSVIAPSGVARTKRRSRLGRVLGVLRIAASFVAVGLLVVLTLQNTEEVSLQFLLWAVTLSRALLVFILIVVGVLLGWVLRSLRDDDGFRLLG